MSQIDTNDLFFLPIMMVVKMAATTARIKYVLVKLYYLTYREHKVILISTQATLFTAYSFQ